MSKYRRKTGSVGIKSTHRKPVRYEVRSWLNYHGFELMATQKNFMRPMALLLWTPARWQRPQPREQETLRHNPDYWALPSWCRRWCEPLFAHAASDSVDFSRLAGCTLASSSATDPSCQSYCAAIVRSRNRSIHRWQSLTRPIRRQNCLPVSLQSQWAFFARFDFSHGFPGYSIAILADSYRSSGEDHKQAHFDGVRLK